MNFRIFCALLSFFLTCFGCQAKFVLGTKEGGVSAAAKKVTGQLIQGIPSYNQATWMTDLWLIIYKIPLRKLVIPGTHDSGTAPISEENAVVANDKGIPHFLSKIAPRMLVAWSKTQNLTVEEQLKIGVRFFDFRVSVENGEDEEVIPYLSHGLRGEKLRVALHAINNFCGDHPKELVIIKVKGFPDNKCKDQNWNTPLLRWFERYLKGKLLLRSECDQRLSEMNLEKIVSQLKRNVILIFDVRVNKKSSNELMRKALKDCEWAFEDSIVESPWANTYSATKLRKFVIENDKSRDLSKLHILHWTLTANAAYISANILNGADGIWYLTQKINGGKEYDGGKIDLKSVVPHLSNGMNIVIQDFVDRRKIQHIIELNLVGTMRQVHTSNDMPVPIQPE